MLRFIAATQWIGAFFYLGIHLENHKKFSETVINLFINEKNLGSKVMLLRSSK